MKPKVIHLDQAAATTPVVVKCRECLGKGTSVSRIGRMQFTCRCERCQGTGKEKVP